MMENVILPIALAIISSGGVGTVILKWIETRNTDREEQFDKIHEKLDGLAEAIDKTKEVSLSTTRDRLNYQCNKFLSQGYISLEDYDAFIDMGNAYVDAGGNSVVKGKFDKCKDLEVK